ncbi:type II secretion system F family protein [Candidatus Micrarchaeota archaeon]|nr:type II secretion system F family protein [Candidatus Micrarchaeota archaeon]
MQLLFEPIGRLFYSRETIRKLETKVNTAGLYFSAEGFAGLLLLLVVLVAILITSLLFGYGDSAQYINNIVESNAKGLPFPVVGLLVFLISFIPAYFIVFVVSNAVLTLKSDSRRNVLEDALPDFLLLVAANIKAGMPLDQAMYHSSKPEYGLLSKEVQDIIKRSFSGESLEESLNMLGNRFDSRLFSRTISLIKQSSATGGEVSAVLERTSQEVRNAAIIKKEVSASLVLYEIFILFASVLGTPFLFAVSGKLVEIFEKTPLAASVPQTTAGLGFAGSLKFSGPVITSAEFFYFTLATIFITSLFSSFIVGVIRAGSKNEGMKYFPFVLLASYVIYFLVNSLINMIFTTIT